MNTSSMNATASMKTDPLFKAKQLETPGIYYDSGSILNQIQA